MVFFDRTLVLSFAVFFLVGCGFGYSKTLASGDGLALRVAVETALANNPQLAVAGSAVLIANNQVREAYSGIYPNISSEASFVRSLGTTQQIIDDKGNADWEDIGGVMDSSWSAALTVNQAVLDFRLFNAGNIAKSFSALRREELRGTAHNVVALVRESYYRALLLGEQKQLTEQRIARLEQNLLDIRALNIEGFATVHELTSMETQLDILKSQLLRAINGVSVARGDLLLVIGEDPLKKVVLQGKLSDIKINQNAVNSSAERDLLVMSGVKLVASQSEEELQENAMIYRSDLRQYRAQQRLSQLQLKIQEAEYFPVVRAFGSVDFGSADNDGDDIFGQSLISNSESQYSQFWLSGSVGISVQMQLFSGFGRDARLAQRSEEVNQSAAVVRQAERQTRHQIHTLTARVSEASTRARSRLMAIEQAREGYQIVSARYAMGLDSHLDVFGAEYFLYESQYGYAEAVHDYLLAISQLEVAVGRVPIAENIALGLTR